MVASSKFWQTHRGLVWSNPDADDSTHIRAALLRPRFGSLLEIALEFGSERLHQEWTVLEDEPTRQVERVGPIVTRILTNIEKGFSIASGGH